MKVRLIADKLQVSTNLVGENNILKFHVGSYQMDKIAKLMLVPDTSIIKLEVEWDDKKSEN